MKLGNFKRIISTDYPQENQALIEQLGRQLNDSIEQLYFAMKNKLSFGDNFAATVKTVDVNVDKTGAPINQTSILLSTSTVVTGCIVVSAVNKTNAALYPTSSPFISFSQNGTTLYINNVTGLQANNTYTLNLIALN
jgi:hypothetical protein